MHSVRKPGTVQPPLPATLSCLIASHCPPLVVLQFDLEAAGGTGKFHLQPVLAVCPLDRLELFGKRDPQVKSTFYQDWPAGLFPLIWNLGRTW